MPSVLLEVDCPRCGAMALADCYYPTGEEFFTCKWCGFDQSLEQEKNEKVVHETRAYAVTEYRQKGYPGKVMDLAETAEDLTQWLLEIEASRNQIEKLDAELKQAQERVEALSADQNSLQQKLAELSTTHETASQESARLADENL